MNWLGNFFMLAWETLRGSRLRPPPAPPPPKPGDKRVDDDIDEAIENGEL